MKNLKFLIIIFAALAVTILVIPDLIRNPDSDFRQNDKQEVVLIGNSEIQVEVADDLAEQIHGLSGRESLCESCGMLFVYSEPQILTFWMKDMKFALDIIFIRDGRVTDIYENVPPPDSSFEIASVTSRQPADMVLEVNGGFSRISGFNIGAEAVLR